MPKAIAEELGITEGAPIVLKVEGKQLIIKPAGKLLKKTRTWAKITPEEVGEGISKQLLT
ncbi:MAG: AbrB family transcriptional regulator [Thermoproteota archaeon]|nr:MAG: AbrB family transcriptional regulator [Candidatus Korarchaeota archaeon]